MKTQKLLLFFTAFLLFGAVSLQADKKAEPWIKALLVTGGCCHDYNQQREILPAAVDLKSKLKVEWTIYHQRTSKGNRKLALYNNPDWADGYDVVVHNECFANIPSGNEAFVENILRPHRDGVPAVLVHCSMHSYRTGENREAWWEFCGLYTQRHDKRYPFEVELVAPEHEAIKGMTNWKTPQGELYLIKKTYPTMTPLAQSRAEKDGQFHTNIWVNEYGPKKTRVFATTIGHHNETMLQDEYMEMFTRGLLWAIGKPVAENINTTK
ncbi:heme-binding protein [Coraliomargarita sinensis]|uniref:Heme-binding protein n=1 Tax=Coraliomargarita sinensis TaxID=2174842 RepID=A0A317ZJL6_9BACT|nr:ThuA domain-containing protein [Coraliomargarita sinensis]PXA03959.1 heme-binding protein [Coraliomargarita sinensis]